MPFPRATFEGCREVLVLYKNELLSGIFVFDSKPIARIRSIFSKRGTASDHSEYQRIGYASRRAMYEVCVWGSNSGRTGIDLASVNSMDESKRGISDFKMSFNPVIVPEYTYTYRSVLYAFFEALMRTSRDMRSTLKK